MHPTYTDEQLKRALAKMLPEKVVLSEWVGYGEATELEWSLRWKREDRLKGEEVKDTELLQLCWEVEETLTEKEAKSYRYKLNQGFLPETSTAQWLYVHATWQQRTIALAEIKGVEVV